MLHNNAPRTLSFCTVQDHPANRPLVFPLVLAFTDGAVSTPEIAILVMAVTFLWPQFV